MDETRILTPDSLDFNDAPEMVWIRVQDAAKLLWNENPKVHNMGDMINSLEKYGMQELSKFDKNLINVAGIPGAVKAGNGRIEALAEMERMKKPLVRGLARIPNTGEWVMPILVGVDAENIDRARAYAIDSNNMVMGGDFTAVDMSRMWDTKTYLALLQGLSEADEPPVTVDKDTIGRLAEVLDYNNPESEGEEKEDEETQDVLLVVIECDTEDERMEIIAKLKSQGIKSRSYSGTLRSKLSLKS